MSDFRNSRVDEFSASGVFVRAFGWDVVASGQDNTGANEQKTVTIPSSVTAGTFTLTVTTATGTGVLGSGSNAVQKVEGALGAFKVGDTITGTGVPVGTTVSAVGSGTLILSQNASSGEMFARVLTVTETTSSLPYNATSAEVKAALEALPGIGAGNITVTGGPGKTTPFTVIFSGGNLAGDVVTMTITNSLTGGTGTVATASSGGGYEVCQAASTPADSCKAGIKLASAGAIGGAEGMAIDQATGNLYIADQTNKRVEVFSATGKFEGAFGQGVKTGAAELQFCTTGTGCQTGTAAAGAGALASLAQAALSVDPGTGDVYVGDRTNLRINEFEPTLNGAHEVTGVSFMRAIGWGVAPGGVNEQQEIRVKATGGKFVLTLGSGGPGVSTTTEIPATASAAEVQAALNVLTNVSTGGGSVSVTGGPGSAGGSPPYVVTFSGGPLAATNVSQLGAASGAEALSGGSPSSGVSVSTRANGTATTTGLEACTEASGCKAGTAGAGDGQMPTGSPVGLAVDSSGAIYMVPALTPSCSIAAPCRVQKFRPDGSFEKTYGPSSGEAASCQLTWTTGEAKKEAAAGIAIDPATQNVLVTRKNAEKAFEVCEFNGEGALENPGSLLSSFPPSSTLESNATNTYLQPAAGTEERIYVNAEGIASQRGATDLLGPEPSASAKMSPVSEFGSSTAKFAGQVTPPAEVGGQTFNTTWHFEYSTNGIEWISAPVPARSAGSSPGVPVTVEESVQGLAPHTRYEVRLCAITAQPVCSAIVQFTTLEVVPTVVSTYPEEVSKSEGTLAAQIDPNNLQTTYHFEWASEKEWEESHVYGHRIPAFERQIGSGGAAISAKDTLSGLDQASVYHFRVVATNAAGTTDGPDQQLETLDSCDLSDRRCFELVSPPDKRPSGSVSTLFETTLNFQAADNGESVAYTIQPGLSNATAGGEVIYVANRQSDGWDSTQASPPALVPSPSGGRPSYVHYFNPNVTCGLVSTSSPLTDDVPQVDREDEVSNLYRRNEDGSFTLITNRAPENPTISAGGAMYLVGGASSNCNRVYFTSEYHFLPGASSLYEWDNGVLRDAGVLPDGTPAPSTLRIGNFNSLFGSRINAVPSDASRVFFTATSDEGLDKGKQAVFMHSDQKTVDVSKSTTLIAPLGSNYEVASEDGGQVFFLSNLGLAGPTGNGSQEQCSPQVATACDLYDFEVESGRLVDITTDNNPADTKGAVVRGVVGVSRDGSYVYFAAEGQLVAGRGKSYAENVSAGGGANIYLFREGKLHYVATVASFDLNGGSVGGHPGAAMVVREVQSYDAWVTPSGEKLLFESRANIDGYEPAGKAEAYLYSAASESLRCVSCRADGQPSVEYAEYTHRVLPGATSLQPQVALHYGRPMSDDGKKVFFTSRDVLAAGGVEGGQNIYEWNEGQTSLITTVGEGERLVDASATGSDVFFTTSARLDPHDFDNQVDLYDARVGGGFPAPEPEPEPCDPSLNCQVAGSPPGPFDAPSSEVFSGPRNLVSGLLVSTTPKHKPKSAAQVRAEKLAKALKACRSRPKDRRRACEIQARKRYGKGKGNGVVVNKKKTAVGKSNRDKKAGR